MLQITDIFLFFDGLTYLSVFLFTFVSAIFIFIPIPYFPILVTAVLSTDLDPNLIAIFGALGALCAKSIIYMISYYGVNLFRKEDDFSPEKYPETFRIIRKYGWIAIFLASVTPIPDNLVYIIFGLCKYHPLKFIAITFAGKILLNEVVIWITIIIGKPIVGNLSLNISSTYFYIGLVLSLFIFLAILFLFLKMNWLNIMEKFIIKIKKLRNTKYRGL